MGKLTISMAIFNSYGYVSLPDTILIPSSTTIHPLSATIDGKLPLFPYVGWLYPQTIQERINFCPSTSGKSAANFGYPGTQAAGADRLQDLLRVAEEGENFNLAGELGEFFLRFSRWKMLEN